jgi:glycosyltransferase involved in cell wall biosynthesis
VIDAELESLSLSSDVTSDQHSWIDMARIALVVSRFELGGVFSVNCRLAEALVGLGHEVCLISVLANESEDARIPGGVSHACLGAKRVLTSVSSLRNILKRDRFDAVAVSQIHVGVVGVLSQLCRKGPRILVLEHSSVSYWRQSSKRKDQLMLMSAKILLKRADAFGSVSKVALTQWRDYLKLSPTRSFYLPNPVLSGAEDLFTGRSSENRSGVLFVGRLAREKRVDLLIKAFANSSNTRMERLVIAGDGPLRRELTTLISDLRLGSRVDLLGRVDDIPALMRRNRLLVLCSDFEGMPTVLIEGLAYGCQVISTNCPTGPAEILDNGKFGVLITPGDVGSLEKALNLETDMAYHVEELRSHLQQFVSDNAVLHMAQVLVRGLGHE